MLTINVAAISEGQSKFETDVTAQDSDLLENEEFRHPIHILHNFNRVSEDVFVKTLLTTKVDLTCDVCLDEFQLDISEEVEIILTKDSNLVERGEEDVYLITDSTRQVDITDSVRQSLLLAVPYKKMCRPECKGLCSNCGTNLNHELCCCANEHVDSRWQGLKNITFNND